MTLDELKKQHPEAYTSVMQEAQAIVVATKETEHIAAIAKVTEELGKATTTITTLKAEKKISDDKVDTYVAKEAVAAKKQLVERLIKEAKEDTKNKLPETAITPYFIATLEAMKDEVVIKEAIEDRKKVVAGVTLTASTHIEEIDKNKTISDSKELMEAVAKDLKM